MKTINKGYTTLISHRYVEIEDHIILDRTTKYNQLLKLGKLLEG